MGVIRWLNRIYWTAMAFFLLVCAFVAFGRLGVAAADHPPARFAIVLGSGTHPDGILSYYSRMRVRFAIGLLKDGEAARLILSDGTGSFDGTTTARRMEEFALSLGASPDQLLVEPNALNTLENLAYGMAIAVREGAAPDGSDTVLVTDAYHMTRAIVLARYLGYDRLTGIPANEKADQSPLGHAIHIVYEAAAVIWNVFRIVRWEIMGPPPAAGTGRTG